MVFLNKALSRGDGDLGESVDWELGMKKSPASRYGGGWFSFEGLCATLLARTGINPRAIFTKSAQSGLIGAADFVIVARRFIVGRVML
jgi:hypothetical protein